MATSQGNSSHCSSAEREAAADSTAVRIAEAAIIAYRMLARPLLGTGCRFVPSCSEYARQAVRRHGVARGARMAAARVARCHPWAPGGYDAVPGEET